MNLWAKSLRQLSFVAAVALFFFSCEDENTILGFRNPVPKFNVSYVEIPLASNSQLIDSIVTDNKGGSGNLLVGRYNDNTFGTVTAIPYLQIIPSGSSQIPSDAIFDSLTFRIRFNFYSYGFAGERTERFAIHEMLDSLDRLLISNSAASRYEFDKNIQYKAIPVGQASVTVNTDSLQKQSGLAASAQDTLIARGRLDDEYGFRIFSLAQEYPFNSSSHFRAFNDLIRGLALVPTESQGVLGFRIFNSLSSVTIHYRTLENGNVKDTLSRSYGFGISSFTNINVDRAASPLSGAAPYQSLSEQSTVGSRYIQSGNPVITKLDLSNFYSFADTVGNVLVNEASLVIDGVETPLTTPPISELCLKVMNENNQFTNYALASTDRVTMAPYALSTNNPDGMLVVDAKHYVVKSDIPGGTQIASLGYSSGAYSGYITLFLQQLLKHRNSVTGGINPTRLRYLGLYPLTPSMASSVSRTAFNAGNVKLRIYYTKPTLTTTPN